MAKALAERCVAGEFGGIAYRAAQEPAAAASRVAENNRVDHERAKAPDCGGDLRVLFVEKGGAPPLEKVSEKLAK